MKLKPILLFLLLFFSSYACLHAGTVDIATLDPAFNSGPSGAPLSFSFSALNDKAFSLKSYAISISYDAGLNISNLTTNPVADTASINTNKRVINLIWADIPAGLELQATFDVTGNSGTYALTPSESTFSDYGKGKNSNYTGTCNTAQAQFASGPPPKTPYSVRSTVVTGGINIVWNFPTNSQVSEYRIYRRTTDTQFDPSSYFTSNSSTYIDSSIQPGTVYFYCVAAVNADGVVGSFSAETADVIYDLSLRT